MKYFLVRIFSLILLSSGVGSQSLAKSGSSSLSSTSKSCLSLLATSPSSTAKYLLEGVDESLIKDYLYEAGLRIMAFNKWDLPVIDARKTHEDMMVGFSGAVFSQITKSRTNVSLSQFGLNLTQELVLATDANSRTGAIVYVYERLNNRIIFVGVPLGWESNIEAISSVAAERLGQYLDP